MNKFALAAIALSSAAAFSAPASAACVGTCGTASANGVVTAPPAYGPGYGYISTVNGADGAGQIASVGGTNGSEYTATFTANAGDALNFYFNYVTSDGDEYSDYAFAELLDSMNATVAYLFTARTTLSGDTSPGFGLPANASTLSPGNTPIIGDGPVWAQLGAWSGECWASGCGYTGWINSNYTIGTTGSYKLRLGVTNFTDGDYDSGMAFAGITVAGNEVPLPSVPEASTWAMLILGFGVLGSAMRRTRKTRATLAFI